jgi:hypothetical protein
MVMPMRFWLNGWLLPCVLLAACSGQQQVAERKEDILAASGFVVRPANTPQRQAMLRQLPPHRFVQQVRGTQTMYVFADPLVCDCLYVGNEEAYGRYRQNVKQRQIAVQQIEATMMKQSSGWDWGAWGELPHL